MNDDPKSTSKDFQSDEFEEQLRRSLRRVEAPKGFAARILERAGVSEKPLLLKPRFRRGPRWGWIGALATILVLVALVGNQVRVRRERAGVAQIQAQFDTAMRVTSHALEETRVELERAGVRFDE
jgi:flagellar basal body rod protein FlgB